MKVLISPIGQRDPWGEPGCQRPEPVRYGAALSIALACRPEEIFLLPTLDRIEVGAGHTMEEAHATVAALHEVLPAARVRIRAYNLGDPTDYAQVLPETERLLRGILGELGDVADLDLMLNVSSGTPQIQAALQLAISAGLVPGRALQSRDPRYLRQGEDQVREVAPRYWSEAFATDRAHRLFEQSQFEAAAVEVEFLLQSPQSHRRAAARRLHALCQMYAALHHVDYYAADRAAGMLLPAIAGAADYLAGWPLLEAQAALLRRLPRLHPRQRPEPGSHAETPEFLADIYHNAARCYARRIYADSLARVWRALEGALFLRLRERHGVEPNDVRASPNQQSAQAAIAFMRREQEREVKITLGSAERLLAECLPDQEYRALLRALFPGTQRSMGKVVERLREARNNSVVGHNALPVTEDMARDGLALARLMLEALVPGVDIAGHPFAPEAIAAAGKVFFDALQG